METTIHKCQKSRLYTKISNNVLQNTLLSFKARGLIAYILSLPDSWVLSVEHLATASPQGREAVQGAIKELQSLGYMQLIIDRDAGTGRIVKRRWIAYDDPSENPELIDNLSIKRVSPPMGLPVDGKPAAIKETLKEKKLGEKGNMCSSPKPDEHAMPDQEALEEEYPELSIGSIARAHSQAEDDLAKGKRIHNLKAYIIGLAKTVEASMP